jgi:hypothetical protein
MSPGDAANTRPSEQPGQVYSGYGAGVAWRIGAKTKLQRANLQVRPVLVVAERGKLLTISKTNSRSIGEQEKSGETWIVQMLLQPIFLKSDRLLPARANGTRH